MKIHRRRLGTQTKINSGLAKLYIDLACEAAWDGNTFAYEIYQRQLSKLCTSGASVRKEINQYYLDKLDDAESSGIVLERAVRRP